MPSEIEKYEEEERWFKEHEEELIKAAKEKDRGRKKTPRTTLPALS